MLDAGSTGSRIHAYEFDLPPKGRARLLREVFQEIRPGLSSYGVDAKGAAASIVPLLNRADAAVPSSVKACTPVELKATAGLRLLGAEKSQAILRAVEQAMRESGFRVGDNSAIVMDGRDEGPYAWLTVNFLLGTTKAVDAAAKPAAVIDLGGASTQVVFVPDQLKSLLAAPPENVYTMKLDDGQTSMYQHSHLGYGLKEAGKKIAKLGGASTTYPCFPHGYKHEGFEATNTEAKANFDKCLPFAEKILNKDAPCSGKSCSFNGVFQPSLKDAFSGPIYAFSYFYDRMEPFLRADGVSSVGQLKEVGTKVCDGTEAPYSEHAKGTMCLDFAYLYALLHTGYDLPDETPLYIKKKIDGFETAWSLGAALLAL